MDIKSVPMAAADAIVRMLTFIVDVMLSLPWPVEHGWLDNGLPVSLARCCAVAALPMTMTMTPMFPQASALSGREMRGSAATHALPGKDKRSSVQRHTCRQLPSKDKTVEDEDMQNKLVIHQSLSLRYSIWIIWVLKMSSHSRNDAKVSGHEESLK